MVEVSKDGLANYRHKLWMVACHASGGGIPEIEGVDRPTNDICVQISAHHNAIWKSAQETAAETIATLQAERDRYRVLEQAARTYAMGWMMDEADDAEFCGIDQEQHLAAVAVFDALSALSDAPVQS